MSVQSVCVPAEPLWVAPFGALGREDVARVGGKNASLGEMTVHLARVGVRVPGGFALTVQAFHDDLAHNRLDEKVRNRLEGWPDMTLEALTEACAEVREWILSGTFPPGMAEAVHGAMAQVEGHPGLWAVRSSATAEDSHEHSFAGQQESFLNVPSEHVAEKIRGVWASLFHPRALSYRIHRGLQAVDVSMSVGVQRMVSGAGMVSGVMFTLHPESGSPDVILVQAARGLGESLVQGEVVPDAFWIFKPALLRGDAPVLRREPGVQGQGLCLGDDDVIRLARHALDIQAHYGCPMDIEWVRDDDGVLFILQARPETVNQNTKPGAGPVMRAVLEQKGRHLASGQAIGQGVGSGQVHRIRNFEDIHTFAAGDVLVTDTTHPQWEPAMKKAAAIVTRLGGRTCHAAIVARELGVPAVVGCGEGVDALSTGQKVTVSCAEGEEGAVYEGILPVRHEVCPASDDGLPPPPVPVMINLGNPGQAFHQNQKPQAGVGLARLEFIINRSVGLHPCAALAWPDLDPELAGAVARHTAGYSSPRAFYTTRLTEGIATIAAAFEPKPVIVRFSDFKSHEYRKLLGGEAFEPEEENPMLGFRGVTRYLSDLFAPAFAMECEAIRHVREDMGLRHVQVMVPFVRTVNQARQVTDLMARNGLVRGEKGLKVIMMCELPANALLAEEFLEFFDGFSIGSNDMTQLTLGLDRDSGLAALNRDFNEQDPAVLFLLERAIQACRKQGKYVGICGQGPSDHPAMARWLVDQGISSISLNPDAVLSTWRLLAGRPPTP